MNFVYPDIDFVFDTEDRGVHTLVIENQSMFQSLLEDIYNQLQGDNGKSIISDKYKPLAFAKHCEMLSQFIPFSLNKKPILTKVSQLLSTKAMSDDHFLITSELLSNIESIMYNLAFDLDFDLDFSFINIESLIKSVGVLLKDTHETLGEKIIDYIEIVNRLERRKIYFLINIRSYISDEEMLLFIETVLQHDFDVIIIESAERPLLKGELRYVIDKSLCEIVSTTSTIE